MAARITAHRARRPAAWETIEASRDVVQAMQNGRGEPRIVLIDCVTLLVSNVLLADEGEAEAQLIRGVDELIEWQRAHSAEMIAVSNEVGLGLVPEYPLGRAYRDLLGTINRRVARQADEVFLMVAGLPLDIKMLTARPFDV